MYNNVFYQAHLNIVGGVETFLFELARLTHQNHRDFTVIYGSGDRAQILRLQKYCRCLSLDEVEKPIKCKRAFFNFSIDSLKYFEAEEYYRMIHADFSDPSLKYYQPEFPKDIEMQYLAVSQNNQKTFKERFGIDSKVIYNPLQIDEDIPKVMTLVSAQRLTAEKGGDRMKKIIEELDKAKIPYVWHIFSNGRLDTKSPNVMHHEPTLDCRTWYRYADYMVALSDTEGFSYTMYEALVMGVPLITTRLPVLKDMGVDETNSIILNFDLSNLDVQDIYKRAGTFKFKYSPKPVQPWLDLLQGESNYVYEPPKTIKVRAKIEYFDLYLNRIVKADEVIEPPVERAEKLVEFGYAKYK